MGTCLSIVAAPSSPIQRFKYLRQNCSSIKSENKTSVWGRQFPLDFLPEVTQVGDLGCWWAWEQETSLAFGGPTLPEGTLRNCYFPTHISPCGLWVPQCGSTWSPRCGGLGCLFLPWKNSNTETRKWGWTIEEMEHWNERAHWGPQRIQGPQDHRGLGWSPEVECLLYPKWKG